MSIEQASELIKSLTMNFLGEAIDFDENGFLELAIEEKIPVIINFEDEIDGVEGLIINCVLGSVEPSSTKGAELMYELLEGNYMWGLTAGGTIGIDSETELCCLTRIVELPIEQSAFMDIFIQLISAAKYWAERIEEDPNTENLQIISDNLLKV